MPPRTDRSTYSPQCALVRAAVRTNIILNGAIRYVHLRMAAQVQSWPFAATNGALLYLDAGLVHCHHTLLATVCHLTPEMHLQLGYCLPSRLKDAYEWQHCSYSLGCCRASIQSQHQASPPAHELTQPPPSSPLRMRHSARHFPSLCAVTHTSHDFASQAQGCQTGGIPFMHA